MTNALMFWGFSQGIFFKRVIKDKRRRYSIHYKPPTVNLMSDGFVSIRTEHLVNYNVLLGR